MQQWQLHPDCASMQSDLGLAPKDQKGWLCSLIELMLFLYAKRPLFSGYSSKLFEVQHNEKGLYQILAKKASRAQLFKANDVVS